MKRLDQYPPTELQTARETVADWWATNAREVRQSDPYAPHVTEEQKDQLLADSLANAESISRGERDTNFTIWQRINLELTGECVALLP